MSFDRVSGVPDFQPVDDVPKFAVLGIVAPDAMPIQIPRTSGIFADHGHANSHGREFVVHRHHNGFG